MHKHFVITLWRSHRLPVQCERNPSLTGRLVDLQIVTQQLDLLFKLNVTVM